MGRPTALKPRTRRVSNYLSVAPTATRQPVPVELQCMPVSLPVVRKDADSPEHEESADGPVPPVPGASNAVRAIDAGADAGYRINYHRFNMTREPR